MKSYRKYLVLLPLSLAAIACALSGTAGAALPTAAPLPATATLPPTAAPTATIPPLTADALQNMEYTLPVSQKKVKLSAGKYQAGEGADFLAVGMAEPIGFGDLNGDGLPDAAVVLGENTGGSGTFESLVVVANQGGIPVQTDAVQIGDRVQVNAITIQDERVTLDEIVPGPQDPMCCPSQPVTDTYRITQGGLFIDQVTSKTSGGKERAIRIESPAGGSAVGGSVEVTGSETIAPFENRLVYRIYDAENHPLDEGPITAQAASPGGPATFKMRIDLSKAPAEAKIWLSVMDLSAASGSPLALSSIALIKN
jgi:hypothetical protein